MKPQRYRYGHKDMYLDDEGPFVRIADILALNPLVPVPDGQPCTLDMCESTHCLYEGHIYCSCEDGWFEIKDPFRVLSIPGDIHVQPVRLVPLKEVCDG